MKAGVLILAALSLSCAPSGGATYEDVCRTAHEVCSAADLLCMFAPKAKVERLTKEQRVSELAILMHRIDSLAIVLHEQSQGR